MYITISRIKMNVLWKYSIKKIFFFKFPLPSLTIWRLNPLLVIGNNIINMSGHKKSSIVEIETRFAGDRVLSTKNHITIE